MADPERGAGGAVDPRESVGWPEWPSRRARLLLPVVISLFVQVPAAFFGWRGPGPRFGRPTLELNDGWQWPLALALIGSLALVWARRFPGPVVAFVAAASVADLTLQAGTPGPPFIALGFAIVGAIARDARAWAWIASGALWLATLATWLVRDGSLAPGRAAFTTLGTLAMLGIGEAVRARRERAAAHDRALAERRQTAAEAERVRIARELHDVLAHSLSSINVQAGVGLHLMEQDHAAGASALANIKSTSKTALEEVRSVLGVLRSEGDSEQAPLDPEPDLAQLDRLTTSVTAQGIPVALELQTELLEAPRAVQLALYRIVQESLTNVLRHSGAGGVSVSIRSNDTHYVARVSDDGAAKLSNDESTVGGRGLLGMRERAELLGGTLEAGPRPGGGFRVLARIPKTSQEPS